MNQKELKELIEFLIEKDIAEFELERGDVKVRIKRGSEPVASVAAPDARFFAVHPAVPASKEAGGQQCADRVRARVVCHPPTELTNLQGSWGAHRALFFRPQAAA